MRKIDLAYEWIDLQANIQNQSNLYLKVLMYFQATDPSSPFWSAKSGA